MVRNGIFINLFSHKFVDRKGHKNLPEHERQRL